MMSTQNSGKFVFGVKHKFLSLLKIGWKFSRMEAIYILSLLRYENRKRSVSSQTKTIINFWVCVHCKRVEWWGKRVRDQIYMVIYQYFYYILELRNVNIKYLWKHGNFCVSKNLLIFI